MPPLPTKTGVRRLRERAVAVLLGGAVAGHAWPLGAAAPPSRRDEGVREMRDRRTACAWWAPWRRGPTTVPAAAVTGERLERTPAPDVRVGRVRRPAWDQPTAALPSAPLLTPGQAARADQAVQAGRHAARRWWP